MRIVKAGQFSDGAWDCSHAYEPDTHREAWRAIGYPTDLEAAINVVREAWGNDADAREAWILANGADIIADSRGTVDPADEYRAWSEAWQAKAVSYTRDYMREWIHERE